MCVCMLQLLQIVFSYLDLADSAHPVVIAENLSMQNVNTTLFQNHLCTAQCLTRFILIFQNHPQRYEKLDSY